MDPRTCPACGHAATGDEKFCTACGGALPEVTVMAPGPAPEARPVAPAPGPAPAQPQPALQPPVSPAGQPVPPSGQPQQPAAGYGAPAYGAAPPPPPQGGYGAPAGQPQQPPQGGYGAPVQPQQGYAPQGAPAQPYGGYAPAPAPQKKSKAGIIVVAVVLVVAIMLGIFWLVGRDGGNAGGGGAAGITMPYQGEFANPPYTMTQNDLVIKTVQGERGFSFRFENTSDKTITYFEIWVFCYDQYGNPLDGEFEWRIEDEATLAPGDTYDPSEYGYYAFDDVDGDDVAFGIPYIHYVEFDDDTYWGITDFVAEDEAVWEQLLAIQAEADKEAKKRAA